VHARFPSAKNKIVSYRVNSPGEPVLNEGFDDDGEAGAGEKLLGVL